MLDEQENRQVLKRTRTSSNASTHLYCTSLFARPKKTSKEGIHSFMQGHVEIVVEPLLRNIMEFSVTVIDTPDGPRAFMPLEIEVDDPELDFMDFDLEVQKFFATTEVRKANRVLRPPLISISICDVMHCTHVFLYKHKDAICSLYCVLYIDAFRL